MIQNASFQRKIIYMGLIALLLIPLYTLGNPATGDPTDAESTPGGKLAQLRAQYDLSQAALGEIDPASESMKLATLGLRGVATNILWTKANHYKKTENWDALIAVVNQMVKLQPNFISVWEFQSHNLSYNVSVEHDDYRFRYGWVKKGIDFLIKGTKYNRREPRLFWSVGWYTGQKFGRSDERKQFRQLFADDEDFHATLEEHVPLDFEGKGPSGKADSWLVSKLWFENAYSIIDTQGVPLRGKSPHIFYADGPKAQMSHATAIEVEGYFDERAEDAWRTAGNLWGTFGRRRFPTSWGEYIRLSEKELKLSDAERLKNQLDEMVPGAREAIYAEKFAKLPLEQQELLESEEYDPDKYVQFIEAAFNTQVRLREIAEQADRDNRADAFRLADAAAAAAVSADRVDRYRQNVNYEYWKTRCEVEQLPGTVAARKHAFEANRLMDEVLIDQARAEFELAWDRWAEIFENHPELVQELMADDLIEDINRYLELLGQLDEELPEDFKLKKILELQVDTELYDESVQTSEGASAP
jgi:hypothetical protein